MPGLLRWPVKGQPFGSLKGAQVLRRLWLPPLLLQCLSAGGCGRGQVVRSPMLQAAALQLLSGGCPRALAPACSCLSAIPLQQLNH
jgi:hypothetical protein